MRQIYDFPEGQVVIESVGSEVWVAHVEAHQAVFCENGIEHTFDCMVTIEVTDELVENDKAWLDAYEWAIRGNARAAKRLWLMVVDDEMYANYMDPCEVN